MSVAIYWHNLTVEEPETLVSVTWGLLLPKLVLATLLLLCRTHTSESGVSEASAHQKMLSDQKRISWCQTPNQPTAKLIPHG